MKKENQFDGYSTTQTESTTRHYENVYDGFVKMAVEHALKTGVTLPEDEPVDPNLAVDAFMRHRSNFSDHTDRQYRAAFLHVLREKSVAINYYWGARERFLGIAFPYKDEDGYFKENKELDRKKWMDEFDRMKAERLEREEKRRLEKVKKNTSAQKAKSMKSTDIELMLNALSKSKSKYRNDAAVWFQSALITGLRPSEWALAEITNDKIGRKILKVKNGKATNDRSFGKFRHLVINSLDPLKMEIIEIQLANAHAVQARGQFVAWYEACRNVIKLLARELWPDRTTFPSLYTARHLFAANAKNKLSRKEVAALMGHGSEFTAGQHYARRHASIGGLDVEASEEDLNALTLRNGETSQEPKNNEWLLRKNKSVQKTS